MLKIGTKLICNDKSYNDCIFYIKEYKKEYYESSITLGIDKYKQNFHTYSLSNFEELIKTNYFIIYYPSRLELLSDL